MNRALDAVVGGWQVNAILSFHGGFPLTVSNQVMDTSGTGQRSSRANCIAPSHVFGKQDWDGSGGGFLWFDPSTFAAVPTGSFGTCGVGTVRGPGLSTADLSLSKRFSITERQNLELRGEFINALNHPILNAPDTTQGDVNFGVVQKSQGARNIQLGLKYSF
jgi:hypothetical protein